MARHRELVDELHRFWAHQQAAEGLSVRNSREAWLPHGARRQGTCGEARSQRSVPLRVWTAVSSAAASAAVVTTGSIGTTTF